MPQSTTTPTLDLAREIIANGRSCSTDTPSEAADWVEAAQCAIDGDDRDFLSMLTRADAFESYQGVEDFDLWFERSAVTIPPVPGAFA